MRSRLFAAALVATSAVLSACFSDRDGPTEPGETPAQLVTAITASACASTNKYVAVDAQVKYLIDTLFTGQRRTLTRALWDTIKANRALHLPLQAHIDELASATLGDLLGGSVRDPDGNGTLTAETGSMRMMDLVFSCTGLTPSALPQPPVSAGAVLTMVEPSAVNDQQFTTVDGDAAVFIPAGALEDRTMLLIVMQPELPATGAVYAKASDVQVNTPFPKLSKTASISFAGGRIRDEHKVSVLFCPIGSEHSDAVLDRAVVAVQASAAPAGAPIGQGVVYLDPPTGGNVNCTGETGANWRMEKGFLRQRAMQVAWLAKRALSYVAPRQLYAARKPVGGATSEDAAMVVVDPYLETEIVITPSAQPLAFGDNADVTARVRIRDVATNPAVYRGQFMNPDPVTAQVHSLSINARIDAGAVTLATLNNVGLASWGLPCANVGTHTATVQFPLTEIPANAPLFGASSALVPFTVNPRDLTVTADAKSRLYGDANPALTGTFTGVQSQCDDPSRIVASNVTTATPQSNVGTYPITADVTFDQANGDVSAANYNVIRVNGVLTVDPAPLDAVADNATRQFGMENPALTGSFTGLRNGDNITLTFSTTATVTSNVGTYPIVASVGPTGSNYVLRNTTNGTLSITPRPLTITTADAARLYGDANPTFTGTSNALGEVTITYSSTAGPTSNVGTYPIAAQVSGAAAANYSPVTVTGGTLTVNPAPLNASANNASRVYGDANPTFAGTVNGTRNGDVVSITVATTANAQSPVGTYTRVPTLGASGSNYFVESATNGTLTVTPRPLNVVANDVVREYADPNPAFTGSVTGLVNGDAVTVAYSTTAIQTSDAGAYAITPQVSGSPLSNYTLNATDGILTVSTAPLDLTADNVTRTYGNTTPALTASVVGAKNGDFIGVFARATPATTALSPVGTYSLRPMLAESYNNYHIRTENLGTLTIVPRPISAVADGDGASVTREYGDPNATFTGSITSGSLVAGDGVTMTYVSNATQTSDAGLYAITPTLAGAAAGNYALTATDGILTVNTAPLILTANNTQRTYGNTTPALTGTVTGAKNGDFIGFFVRPTPATSASSPVGTYSLRVMLADAYNNYHIEVENLGTLTIVPRPLTGSIDNKTKVQGAVNPALTATGVAGQLFGFVPSYTTTAIQSSPAGTYPITFNTAATGASNYVWQGTNGTLTVTPP
jgi:hypothetical protein